MAYLLRKSLSSVAAAGIAAAVLTVPVSFNIAGISVTSGPEAAHARRGADDGANHNAGDDRGRRGRDGGKGRGRGADDGPNHTSINAPGTTVIAKRGADDGANHNVGDDRGRRGRDGGKGRGRGADDGPNHTSINAPGTTVIAKRGADDGAARGAGDDRGRGRGKRGDDPVGHG